MAVECNTLVSVCSHCFKPQRMPDSKYCFGCRSMLFGAGRRVVSLKNSGINCRECGKPGAQKGDEFCHMCGTKYPVAEDFQENQIAP